MLAALLLSLLAQAPPARSGTLVLCGEGFELDEALARELGGARPHLVLDLDGTCPDALARGGTQAVRPDLSGAWNAQRETALLPELARTGAIVVNATTWISCWQHFKPENKDSRLEQELRAALRAGRTLIATGAAAAYCGSWSLVRREEIARAQRNPRRDDPTLVANGLDFATGWMVESAAQKQAGATRLLRASQQFGNARALFLSGQVAWIVRGGAEEAELAGSGFAVAFDLAHARRSREDLREARLLILGAGDRLRFSKEIEVEPAAGERRVPGWKTLGLPFEPAHESRPGLEYRFDWIAPR
jgi:hypothetical protein